MRVAFHDHDGKGAMIRAALEEAGHEVLIGAQGEVGVTDHDCPVGDRKQFCDSHEVVVVYPHGGNVGLYWDGHPPHPHTRLFLVAGPGHAQVHAMHGLSVPAVPIGFTMCETSPPVFPSGVSRVLFAPYHPMDNGYLDNPWLALNASTFEDLVALARQGLRVQVSVWGDLDEWGLREDDAVEFVELATTELIDAADVVIASETAAHKALARGRPLVMLGADIRPDQSEAGPPDYPPNWEVYASHMRYPISTGDGPLAELFSRACKPDPEVERYRARFIGGAFDAQAAVKLITNAHRLVRS